MTTPTPPAVVPFTGTKVAGEDDFNTLRDLILSIAERGSTPAFDPTAILARLDSLEKSVPAGRPAGPDINFDDFSGSTDDAKLDDLLKYVADPKLAMKPTIRLASKEYSWNGTRPLTSGLTFLGPNVEREYKPGSTFWSNKPSCMVHLKAPDGGYFWAMPGQQGAKSYLGSLNFQGIHWDGGNQKFDFIQPYSVLPCPILTLSIFRHSGWTNFRKPFENIVEACDISDYHFQSNAASAIHWAGADSHIGVVGEHQYIDHEGSNLPSLWLRLDASKVSGQYITPSGAGCAVRYDGGSGTQFDSNNFDSAAQQGAGGMCNGSLIRLRGGVSTWTNTRLFGAMLNPALADGGVADNKGYITISGGSHAIVGMDFENATSRNSVDLTPANTPHIYVTKAAKKVVIAAIMAADPATLSLVQERTGLFIQDLSSFIRTTA